jgi:hypothetical protein
MRIGTVAFAPKLGGPEVVGSPMIDTGQVTYEVVVRSDDNGLLLLVISLLHVFEQQLHRPAIINGMVYSAHERPSGCRSLTDEAIASERTTAREPDDFVLCQVASEGPCR